MKIIYDSYTDKGAVREINQDSIYAYINVDEKMAIFCVADGMGGHIDGEKASTRIVECLTEWAENYYDSKYEGSTEKAAIDIEACIVEANRSVFTEYNQSGSVCGSTIALLYIHESTYIMLHVGDSRIYRKRGFRFECMTRDDTWENQFDYRERYTLQDLRKRPEYGKLVKAVGVREKLIPNIQTGEIKSRDRFLLCSDGLYKFCSEKDINKHLKQTNSISKMLQSRQKLIKKVLSNRSNDNISCISIYVA